MADTEDTKPSTSQVVAFWLETSARLAIPLFQGIADIARTWGDAGLDAARAHADAKVKAMDLANSQSRVDDPKWRAENDARAAAKPPRPVAPTAPVGPFAPPAPTTPAAPSTPDLVIPPLKPFDVSDADLPAPTPDVRGVPPTEPK